MAEIPADAQRSPDGYYWWDGSAWQPVNADSAAGQQPEAAASPEVKGKLEHKWGASVLDQVEVPEMSDEAPA